MDKGNIAGICLADGEKPESKQKRMEQKFSSLQIVPNVERLGTAKVCIYQLMHLQLES